MLKKNQKFIFMDGRFYYNTFNDNKGTFLNSYEECEHKRIDYVNYTCLDCGFRPSDNQSLITKSQNIIYNFSEQENATTSKSKNKKLFDSRDCLNLSDAVIERAEEISKFMIKMPDNRGKRRRYRKFVCLFHACRELGIDYDIDLLCSVTEISRDEVGVAFDIFSPANTGYDPNSDKIFDIPDLIKEKCKKINISDLEIENAITIFNYCDTHSHELRSKDPKTLAEATIKFTLEMYGISVQNIENWNQIITTTTATLNTVYNLICKIYNS